MDECIVSEGNEDRDLNQFEADRLRLETQMKSDPHNEKIQQQYTELCLTAACACMNEGRNWPLASDWLQRALHYQETDAETWLDLGTAYANQNMVPETLQAWKKALEHLDENNEEHVENIQNIAVNLLIIAEALNIQLHIADTADSVQQAIEMLQRQLAPE